MKLSRLKLKLPLPIIAMVAMALSASAQQNGQPIVFSSLQTNAASAGTPSLTPLPADQRGFADEFRAPQSLLNSLTSQKMPPPPQALSPAGQQRMKQLQEDRKNWALMTPEEILGVKTSDKDDNPEKQSQIERYLDRQNKQNGGSTNNSVSSPWNFSREKTADPFSADSYQSGIPALGLTRFYEKESQNKANVGRNESYRRNGFGSSQSQSRLKPDAAQQAAMDRFRELLEPSQISVLKTPSPNNDFSQEPKLIINPNIIQPAFLPNPMGASFTPLVSGINRPTGIKPLPGIIALRSEPVVVPAWAPQPAPWVQPFAIPQPFTIPQRKF